MTTTTPAGARDTHRPDTGTDGETEAAAAMVAAEHGWHVFPCLPDGKKPAVRDWPNRAIGDPAAIAARWPTGGYNVGIACGPSSLVVVDLDRGKPLPAPWDAMPGVVDGEDVLTVLRERHDPAWPSWPDWYSTYTVSTPSGGLHLYFAAPDDVTLHNTSNHLGPSIDTRADGGYVLAAGSVVDGVAYQVISDCDPQPLPAWLSKLLTPAPRPSGPRHVSETAPRRYVAVALDRELDAVRRAPDGGRNEQLFSSAFSLSRFVDAGQLDGTRTAAALLDAGLHAGLSEHEAARTIRSALDRRGVMA